MRLQRLIAKSTDLSRRAAEKVIEEGGVEVNGEVVTKLGTTVNPYRDHVRFNGKLLKLPAEPIYIIYNKPHGVLVTKSDPENRKTIWEDLSQWRGRLNTAGRLDADAEGLMILSDDGAFLHQLTHPSSKLWKTYRVQVKGEPKLATIKQLERGVKLIDGMTAPAKVRVIKRERTHTWLQMSIHEGKNHQIKRMCEAAGHPVLKLRRVSIGPLQIAKLVSGTWRFLTPPELSALKRELGKKRAPFTNARQ